MEKQDFTKKKGSQQDYNLSFKLAVISQVEKGELNFKQVQEICGIQGRSTVLFWLIKQSNFYTS